MRDKDVIQHIQDLCKERSWTYYRLAKEALFFGLSSI